MWTVALVRPRTIENFAFLCFVVPVTGHFVASVRVFVKLHRRQAHREGLAWGEARPDASKQGLEAGPGLALRPKNHKTGARTFQRAEEG